jgi:hypothetical protein
MSHPIPQKKASNVFPYTREGFNLVDVVPHEASYTKIFRAGMLVSFRETAAIAQGYWQKNTTGGLGEALIKNVDLHDPTYANLAALKLAGIIAYDFPENLPALGDTYGDLDVENRDLGPYINTIAGPMARTSCVIGGQGLIKMYFWNATDSVNAAAQLAAADIRKPVYVSKTSAGFIGKPGHATVTDQSGVEGIVQIGTLMEIPVVGGNIGYVLLRLPHAS